MKRTILGHHLTSFLLSPETAGGGGISSITGNADLDSAVNSRLASQFGVQMEEPTEAERKAAEKAAADANKWKDDDDDDDAGETAEQKAQREAAEAEESRIAAKVKETGKTREEILNEEAADAEAEEARITAKMEETGKTREEILAEEEAGRKAAEEAPEFTPEQQAWLDAQKEAQETELAELRTKAEEADQLRARVEELEATAGDQPIAIAPLHPLLLVDDVDAIATEERKLREFEKWALANWDGVEAVEAKGDQPARPAYSAQQIRERYAEIKQLREELVPMARESLANRQKAEAAARKSYPSLFDTKHPDSKVAQNILRLAPGLKAVIPNIWTVIGDALRGEKARLADEKARAAKTKTTAKPGTARVAPRVPTRTTSGAATGSRPAAAATRKAEPVLNVSKFMEAGGDRTALVQALS